MRDDGRALRKALFTALDGQVTYNSVAVPVFDQKVEGAPKRYILLSNTQQVDKKNKTNFVTETEQSVEVYEHRDSSAKSEVLETITDRILQVLYPTVRTYGFTLDAPFHLTYSKPISSSLYEMAEPAPGKFIHRKRLTIKNRITQS